MFRLIIALLVLIFVTPSCGSHQKLTPSQAARDTRKVMRKKDRAFKKRNRQTARNKRKTGYYNKENAYFRVSH